MSSAMNGVDALALVPAWNEAERIGATVTALRGLPEVAEVLVVSDGSTDVTAARALEAGAHCLELAHNHGKSEQRGDERADALGLAPGGNKRERVHAVHGAVHGAVPPGPVVVVAVLGSSPPSLPALVP